MSLVNYLNSNTNLSRIFANLVQGINLFFRRGLDDEENETEEDSLSKAGQECFKHQKHFNELTNQMLVYRKNIQSFTLKTKIVICNELDKFVNIVEQLETECDERLKYQKNNKTSVVDGVKWGIELYKNKCEQLQQSFDNINKAIENNENLNCIPAQTPNSK